MSYPYLPGGIRLPEVSAGNRRTQVASKAHFTGHITFGEGHGRGVGLESNLEKKVALVLRYAPTTVDLVEQQAFEWYDANGSATSITSIWSASGVTAVVSGTRYVRSIVSAPSTRVSLPGSGTRRSQRACSMTFASSPNGMCAPSPFTTPRTFIRSASRSLMPIRRLPM